MDKETELLLKAGFYRSYVLHIAILIESLIDACVLEYFIAEEKKRDLFHVGFFSTEFMTFEKKRYLLGLIINNSYTEYSKDNSDILKFLVDIRDLRNIVAHRRLIETKEHVENFDGDAVFLHFTTTNSFIPDDTKPHLINGVKMDEFEVKANFVYGQLKELFVKILKQRYIETKGSEVLP